MTTQAVEKWLQIDHRAEKFLGDSWNHVVIRDLKTSASLVIPRPDWSPESSGGSLMLLLFLQIAGPALKIQ